jgi:hypothetical protein
VPTRTWTTLNESCWIERATKQAPTFIQMRAERGDDGNELILRPTSRANYRDVDEDWEGTSVFWPPLQEPNHYGMDSEGWQEGRVVAVVPPENDREAPAILVRTEQAISEALRRAFERGYNVGHREFDFYEPLTVWADAFTDGAPQEDPDLWLRARVSQRGLTARWSREGLDADKIAALSVADRRLGVIWGPPGTGKTYAVGHLVARRMAADPTLRVLVLSISNQAVDVAALAVDDAWKAVSPASHPPDEHTLVRARAPVHERMMEHRRGHMLRGYTTTVAPFKARRHELLEELRATHNLARRLQLREALAANKDAMNRALATLLGKARCVFATVNHALHSDQIDIGSFGLVIVDEAGFVPAASAACVAHATHGVLVVAGDFQQLPPIVNFDPKPTSGRRRRRWPTRSFRSRTFTWLDDAGARAERFAALYPWFGETVFDMLGLADRRIGADPAAAASRIAATRDGWFAMLTRQRRMPAPISDFVGAQVYGGPTALQTVGVERLEPVHCAIDGKAHPMLWLNVDGHTAIGTASQLRNSDTAMVSANLALKSAAAGRSVQVLTRYVAQMKLVRECLAAARPQYGDETLSRVTVSTVHRAQGDEADLVIFDPIHTVPFHVVDERSWRDETRLCNVVVSRARGQMIAFLHPQYLQDHPYWRAWRTAAREMRVPGFAPR